MSGKIKNGKGGYNYFLNFHRKLKFVDERKEKNEIKRQDVNICFFKLDEIGKQISSD